VKSFSHPFQQREEKNNKKVFCFGEHPKNKGKNKNTKQGRRTICGVMAFMVFSDVYDPTKRFESLLSPGVSCTFRRKIQASYTVLRDYMDEFLDEPNQKLTKNKGKKRLFLSPSPHEAF